MKNTAQKINQHIIRHSWSVNYISIYNFHESRYNIYIFPLSVIRRFEYREKMRQCVHGWSCVRVNVFASDLMFLPIFFSIFPQNRTKTRHTHKLM